MKVLLAVCLLAAAAPKTAAQADRAAPPHVVYESPSLIITQVAANTFVHTSFLPTQTFGRVSCNGMVVKSGGETIVFDTPADTPASHELITWITKTLNCRVKAVVPTHFHEDCVGGLPAFRRHGIPSYASHQTIAYARQRRFHVPRHGFTDSLTLRVGSASVHATFFGEGHTKDNVVGYFPTDKVLFGGCLIKELQAGKGNLADANVQAWPATVARVKQAYPAVQVVIPGHGTTGGPSLLDYTMQLFQQP
ncbi:BcII family subclass B1 metallo-beta-lactamase [Hymenobacter coalescens]